MEWTGLEWSGWAFCLRSLRSLRMDRWYDWIWMWIDSSEGGMLVLFCSDVVGGGVCRFLLLL